MKPSASLLTGLMVLTIIASTGQDLLKLSTHAKGVTAITTSGDNKYTAIAQGKDLVMYSAGTDTRIKEFSGTLAGQQGKFNHTRDILDMRHLVIAQRRHLKHGADRFNEHLRATFRSEHPKRAARFGR